VDLRTVNPAQLVFRSMVSCSPKRIIFNELSQFLIGQIRDPQHVGAIRITFHI